MNRRILFVFLFLGCFWGVQEIVFASPDDRTALVNKVITGPDDTVYGIAYNHGIPTRALIAANNLKAPYTLQEGQELIIPNPNEHMVGERETVKTIADDYGLNVDVLAQENDLVQTAALKPGTRLVLPSRDTEPMATALKQPAPEEVISTSSLAPLPLIKSVDAAAGAVTTVGAVAASASAAPLGMAPLPHDVVEELAREKGNTVLPAVPETKENTKENLVGNLATGGAPAPLPVSPPKEEKPKKETAKKEEVKKEKEEVKKEASQAPLFVWPVKGKITSKFKPGGKNDGINIKVATGTAVKAAAGGVVMYAGSELKGFGNLLLIKHEEGWITAYAHNAGLLVKKGDTVGQGQEIATSGKSGDASEPQLHFEIRKGKQPIDPLTLLEP